MSNEQRTELLSPDIVQKSSSRPPMGRSDASSTKLKGYDVCIEATLYTLAIVKVDSVDWESAKAAAMEIFHSCEWGPLSVSESSEGARKGIIADGFYEIETASICE